MEQIGVVGLGLMGASLCKALKAAGYPVLGLDIDESTQKYAELTGTVDGRLDGQTIGDCDYLFIALYPGAAVEYLRAQASRVKKGAIAVDLCGVKRAVCAPCQRLAAENGFTYVGGHPMAGRQFSGIKYAKADLYQGATMILVPRENEDMYALSRLRDLLHAVGFAHVTLTTAEKHDEMIAFTSQLAHVVSNA